MLEVRDHLALAGTCRALRAYYSTPFDLHPHESSLWTALMHQRDGSKLEPNRNATLLAICPPTVPTQQAIKDRRPMYKFEYPDPSEWSDEVYDEWLENEIEDELRRVGCIWTGSRVTVGRLHVEMAYGDGMWQRAISWTNSMVHLLHLVLRYLTR